VPQNWSGPYRDSNSNLSVDYPIASRHTNCAIPAPLHFKGGTEKCFCFKDSNPLCLAEVRLREDKALESGEGKGLGSGHCYEQRKEFDRALLRMIRNVCYGDAW
jgi:hypothetical protein